MSANSLVDRILDTLWTICSRTTHIIIYSGMSSVLRLDRTVLHHFASSWDSRVKHKPKRGEGIGASARRDCGRLRGTPIYPTPSALPPHFHRAVPFSLFHYLRSCNYELSFMRAPRGGSATKIIYFHPRTGSKVYSQLHSPVLRSMMPSHAPPDCAVSKCQYSSKTV